MYGLPQPEAATRWFAERLKKLAAEAALRNASDPLSIFLLYPFPLPIPQLGSVDFFWSYPAARHRLLGQGCVWKQWVGGTQRFPKLSHALRQLQRTWHRIDPEGTQIPPSLFLTLAFDAQDRMRGIWTGFPNSLLALPELLIHQQDARTVLVLSTRNPRDWPRQCRRWMRCFQRIFERPLSAGGTEASAEQQVQSSQQTCWMASAQQALREIRQGSFRKLVLARRVPRPIAGGAVEQLLARLEQRFPDCRIFAIRQNSARFVSASPERLLQKVGDQVRSDALAGTLGLGNGAAQQLLSQEKLRKEQALVAEHIRSTLKPFCKALSPEVGPKVRRLHNLQHLWCEIQGTLAAPWDLWLLAQRLHPTPAVAGTPTDQALGWLRRWDPLERGWYSGIGGWIDPQGDGELDVLLRCALVRDHRADFFAGAGLTADSEPEVEWAETELKLRALWDLFDAP